MRNNFKCKLCGNTDPRYIGIRKNAPYCRRCIGFSYENNFSEIINDNSKILNINYNLTDKQKEISDAILKNFKEKRNILVNAVCGAGKTELVFEVIKFCLDNKLNVGFSIPRRDVVIELSKRLANSFQNTNVTSLYGGHLNDKYGDIICLTTHQLFRFEKYFDLLILDEIDAFPYKGDMVLKAMFERSVKGNYILMSATADNKTIKEFKNNGGVVLELFSRYHNKPIPVPTFKCIFRPILYCYLIYKINRYKVLNKPLLIFIPTIKECEKTFNLIKNFAKQGYFVHSRVKNRNEIIEKFRNGDYKFLLTTSVLERGVTIKNLQVIIVDADSDIYDDNSLIQISGRVGRNINFYKGDVTFLGKRKNKSITEAIRRIEYANKFL